MILKTASAPETEFIAPDRAAGGRRLPRCDPVAPALGLRAGVDGFLILAQTVRECSMFRKVSFRPRAKRGCQGSLRLWLTQNQSRHPDFSPGFSS